VKELLTTLSVGSTHFKSSTKHKIQPLILQDQKAVHIVRNYVEYLRPVSDNLHCLLTYNGKPFKQGTISTYIKSYFQKKGGYNITVTSLRMVQCSEVYKAAIEGRVTESARKQFNYIQGHSERCNNAVYVKLALQANTDIARDTFAKLGIQTRNVDTSPSVSNIVPPSHSEQSMDFDRTPLNAYFDLQMNADIARDTFSRLASQTEHYREIRVPELIRVPEPIRVPELIRVPEPIRVPEEIQSRPKPEGMELSELFPWPFDYLTYYDDWGTEHSCGSKEGSRIPWDAREKQCLRDIFNAKSPDFDQSIDKWKQLLQAVIDDPNARPLFHRHHIADYTRLREGLREKRVNVSR